MTLAPSRKGQALHRQGCAERGLAGSLLAGRRGEGGPCLAMQRLQTACAPAGRGSAGRAGTGGRCAAPRCCCGCPACGWRACRDLRALADQTRPYAPLAGMTSHLLPPEHIPQCMIAGRAAADLGHQANCQALRPGRARSAQHEPAPLRAAAERPRQRGGVQVGEDCHQCRLRQQDPAALPRGGPTACTRPPQPVACWAWALGRRAPGHSSWPPALRAACSPVPPRRSCRSG